MASNWTFGQRIGAGFAAVVAMAMAIGLVAVYALGHVVDTKDRVIHANAQALVDAERVLGLGQRKAAAARGFLLSGDQRYLDENSAAREQFSEILAELKKDLTAEEGQRWVTPVERAELEHQRALDPVLALRRKGAALEDCARDFDREVTPKANVLDQKTRAFISYEHAALARASAASTQAASSATDLVAVIALVLVVVAILIALLLTRLIGRQIGSAVGQVQSSSAELQAAANQQATGAKEQATAMSEITTTISELLATSRQIADSARRVAQIAEQTAASAASGDDTVERGREGMESIRRQVDLIVTNMLELGKKSQQIGAVLDIVSELAEQTNILAINATIEAAGAGESGRRFAVVADEIRKLADRVGGSTKEIRALIDDVRSAVNTTVMTTEGGSKAVDNGLKLFGEVAIAFKQIAGLVSTTTEAAREIELSTKQQSTAVEQVNVAIANTAQATRETETISGQTLQTASELAGLSRGLSRLVQPQAQHG